MEYPSGPGQTNAGLPEISSSARLLLTYLEEDALERKI